MTSPPVHPQSMPINLLGGVVGAVPQIDTVGGGIYWWIYVMEADDTNRGNWESAVNPHRQPAIPLISWAKRTTTQEMEGSALVKDYRENGKGGKMCI